MKLHLILIALASLILCNCANQSFVEGDTGFRMGAKRFAKFQGGTDYDEAASIRMISNRKPGEVMKVRDWQDRKGNPHVWAAKKTGESWVRSWPTDGTNRPYMVRANTQWTGPRLHQSFFDSRTYGEQILY